MDENLSDEEVYHFTEFERFCYYVSKLGFIISVPLIVIGLILAIIVEFYATWLLTNEIIISILIISIITGVSTLVVMGIAYILNRELFQVVLAQDFFFGWNWENSDEIVKIALGLKRGEDLNSRQRKMLVYSDDNKTMSVKHYVYLNRVNEQLAREEMNSLANLNFLRLIQNSNPEMYEKSERWEKLLHKQHESRKKNN